MPDPKESRNTRYDPTETCEKCGGPMTETLWESPDGGHEDYKYTCQKCGFYWWSEGIDA